MKEKLSQAIKYFGVVLYGIFLAILRLRKKHKLSDEPSNQDSKKIEEVHADIETQPININSAKILHSPLARLICTQRFSERPEVYKNYGSPSGHNGLDFRTRDNNDLNQWEQPVFAVLEGKVSESAYDEKFKGNYVRIQHDNGHESVYLHLSRRSVEAGVMVSAAQEIGISGNSGGASEAPHLHFGYRPVNNDKNNGYMGYIDPANLFIGEVDYV